MLSSCRCSAQLPQVAVSMYGHVLRQHQLSDHSSSDWGIEDGNWMTFQLMKRKLIIGISPCPVTWVLQ